MLIICKFYLATQICSSIFRNILAVKYANNKGGWYACALQKQPPEVFYNKRCYTKFTGKHQCQSFFFNKVAEKFYSRKVISHTLCAI